MLTALILSQALVAAPLGGPPQITLPQDRPPPSLTYTARRKGRQAPVSLHLTCEGSHLTGRLNGVALAADPQTPLSLDLGGRVRSFTPDAPYPALTARYLSPPHPMQPLAAQAVITARYNGKTYRLRQPSRALRSEFVRDCTVLFASQLQLMSPELGTGQLPAAALDTPLLHQ